MSMLWLLIPIAAVWAGAVCLLVYLSGPRRARQALKPDLGRVPLTFQRRAMLVDETNRQAYERGTDD